MAALASVPSYTPVRCDVTVEANLHGTDGSDASYQGMASVTGVHTELGAVVLEVEE